MAGPLGPALTGAGSETRQDAPQAAAAANPRSNGSLASSWHDWLTDPGNRSFFLQAGAELLQPPSPGQSAAGQIGAAIGNGFEALDRQTVANQAVQQQDIENKRKAAESASQNELQGAQADYYRGGGSRRSLGGAGDTPVKLAAQYQRAIHEANVRLGQIEFKAGDPVIDKEINDLKTQISDYTDAFQQIIQSGSVAPPAAGAATGAPAPGGALGGTAAPKKPLPPGVTLQNIKDEANARMASKQMTPEQAKAIVFEYTDDLSGVGTP